MSPHICLPKRIIATTAQVEHSGCPPASFTLSSDANGQPEVILDYGRVEKGRPIFELVCVSSSSEIVRFQVVYSETLKEVNHENGDGPYMLFSNAMDSYRSVIHEVATAAPPQRIVARHAQCSQRYQRVRLLTPCSTIVFTKVGFESIRPEASLSCSFHCSDPKLNRIWQQGVRTVDMCTVEPNETQPAWDITNQGTRIHGQHWAPCRHGTRWLDKTVCFEVAIERGGASWGVHMVANGLVFCLDIGRLTLTASEGLSNESSVFPSIPRGEWLVHKEVLDTKWLKIETKTVSDTVSVSINGIEIAIINGLNIHPLLGGADNNSGSVAFGGPAGWIGLYRYLTVTDGNGDMLYSNDFLPGNTARTFTDFAVGSNTLPCLIDGAKRDRAVFGGDLHMTGRSTFYSTANFAAVRGSIKLLTSHQTNDGYLGNLCPVQAPEHTGDEEAPTYAFYSLTYALLLVVAIKDYWLFSGDNSVLEESWRAIEKLFQFVKGFRNDKGLIVAPPPLSMTFFPLGGPVFGVSTEINLAYYDALRSMAMMTPNTRTAEQLNQEASALKSSIVQHLWSIDTGILRMGEKFLATGLCTHVNAYGISLDVSPIHPDDEDNLTQRDSKLLPAFKGTEARFDSARLCSPYSAAFAVEACFKRDAGHSALELIDRVWGIMVDESHPNYSGCLWEAMTLDGEPAHRDTSLNHAWSSGPVFLMPMYLAGLRPTSPGWSEWEARPVYAGLKEVEASVKTPFGLIKIQWNFDANDDGYGTIYLEVPEGTQGRVSPPKGWQVGRGDWTCGYSTENIQVEAGTTRLLLKIE